MVFPVPAGPYANTNLQLIFDKKFLYFKWFTENKKVLNDGEFM